MPLTPAGIARRAWHIFCCCFRSGDIAVLIKSMKDTTMPRPITNGAVVRPTQVELLAVTEQTAPHAYQSPRPVLFPYEYEQRTAVLVVIPSEAASSELLHHLDASGYAVWVVSSGHAAVERAEQMPQILSCLTWMGCMRSARPS